VIPWKTLNATTIEKRTSIQSWELGERNARDEKATVGFDFFAPFREQESQHRTIAETEYPSTCSEIIACIVAVLQQPTTAVPA
jgi:hypothetical protein